MLVEFSKLEVPNSNITINDKAFVTIFDNTELTECLMNLHQLNYMNTIIMTNIFNHQRMNPNLCIIQQKIQ